MNKKQLLGAAIGLILATTTAHAELKDPLPDSLSLGGVTLYGTIDIGYAYQSHGVPVNGQFFPGLEYQTLTTTRNFAGSVSTLAEDGIDLSRIGIRVQEQIANDWNLIARLETAINPLSGELANNCGSIATNSGVKQGQQTANADGSRCGQFLNGPAYGGMSNPALGQLTIGRHDVPMGEALGVYDPQLRAPAFSELGYSGSMAGAGSTEAQRWDDSARYSYEYGAVHFVALYANGSSDGTPIGKSYAGQLGMTTGGLSLDAVYENIKGAVNLRSSFNDPPHPVPDPGLSAYVSDNTSYNLMGKYTFTLADKDSFTTYAGYSHIEKAHADYTGGTAQGGYAIDIAININNPLYYNLYWLGARYVFSSRLSLAAGFYHITQNSYTIGKGATGTQGTDCSKSGTLCAGDFTEASFAVDYVFNKHYDIYAGVNYSQVTDGLAYGYPGATVGTSGSENQTTFSFGGRVRF
jgi:predicted porin